MVSRKNLGNIIRTAVGLAWIGIAGVSFSTYDKMKELCYKPDKYNIVKNLGIAELMIGIGIIGEDIYYMYKRRKQK